MSTFSVEVRRISDVIQHPNADRLTIYKVEGLAYQFCSNRSYAAGDQVVYFPVESVMTAELIELFGLGTMLAGKEHNRVKTVRLRGQVSQGFIADTASVAKHLGLTPKEMLQVDLTEALGITKWEPPPVPCQNGDLVPLPAGLSMYDIEGCDNFPAVVQWIIDQEMKVLVTEKLEGQNFSVTVTKEGQEFVSQRRYSIQEKQGGVHDMWEVARREGILDLAKDVLAEHHAETVTVYGEHCGPGVQGNYYKLPQRTVRFFDMKINDSWVGARAFLQLCKDKDLTDTLVPVLAADILLADFLAGRSVQEAANGKSLVNKDRLREGIVIRPMDETEAPDGFGRLIIKQRDPIYLDKTGN